MPLCPSAACPFHVRFGRPAEYREGMETCSDCGASLVPDPAPEPQAASAAAGTRPREVVGPVPWRAAGVTLLAPGVLLLLGALPTPGIPRDLLESVAFDFEYGADTRSMYLAALGLVPFLFAFGLVELAAVAIPSLRPLRHQGPAGRARLDAWSFRGGVLVAALQATAMAAWLDTMSTSGFLSSDAPSRPLVVLSLTAAATLTALTARFVSRHGLVNGFAAMIGAGVLLDLGGLLPQVSAGFVRPGALVVLALLLGALVKGTLWLMAPASSGVRASAIPSPAAGLVPLSGVTLLVDGAFSFGLPVDAVSPTALLVAKLVVCLPLAVGLCLLFNGPGRIASLEQRLAAGVDPRARAHALRESLPRLALLAALYCAALVWLDWVVNHAMNAFGTPLPVEGVALVAVVAADLLEGWRTQRRAPSGVTAWVLSDTWALGPAVAFLKTHGIHAEARGLRYRVLGQFFVPWAPVEVRVPRADAERAHALLQSALVEPQPATPAAPAPSEPQAPLTT